MKPQALTMGEPGGIGPDITLLAWAQRQTKHIRPFALFADSALLRARAANLQLSVPLEEATLENAADIFATALPVIPLQNPVAAVAGKSDVKNAAAVIESITRAVEAVQNGAASAVVTNPIQKATLKAVGFASPGHTEFLGDLHFKRTGKKVRPVMMLYCDELKTVPLTIHIPLGEVAAGITARDLSDVAYIVSRALQVRFGIQRPRLAVAGLNPHAGEHGTIGSEDEIVLAPAIAALQKEGLHIHGPLSADTLFHDAARKNYDAVIAMYHDQAMIPVKTIAFDRAVNLTLGLDFIRTSPDHGTALDIAGTGAARPGSLIAALELAAKIARVAGSLEGVTVIEIGPGPGGLTRALLSGGARKVIAVEKDKRAIEALQEISARYPSRLEIIEGDALEFDISAYLDACIPSPLAGEGQGGG